MTKHPRWTGIAILLVACSISLVCANDAAETYSGSIEVFQVAADRIGYLFDREGDGYPEDYGEFSAAPGHQIPQSVLAFLPLGPEAGSLLFRERQLEPGDDAQNAEGLRPIKVRDLTLSTASGRRIVLRARLEGEQEEEGIVGTESSDGMQWTLTGGTLVRSVHPRKVDLRTGETDRLESSALKRWLLPCRSLAYPSSGSVERCPVDAALFEKRGDGAYQRIGSAKDLAEMSPWGLPGSQTDDDDLPLCERCSGGGRRSVGGCTVNCSAQISGSAQGASFGGGVGGSTSAGCRVDGCEPGFYACCNCEFTTETFIGVFPVLAMTGDCGCHSRNCRERN